MKVIRKILVPLDFSPHSAQALQYAADLARRYDAKLLLVNVFDLPVYAMPDGMPMLDPGQLEQVSADIERLLEQAKHDALVAGALIVETQLLQGNPGQEILRVAREAGIDLIVLGTHGRTGLKHLLIGSVAERIVRHAPCPVFAVKSAPPIATAADAAPEPDARSKICSRSDGQRCNATG